MKLLTLFVVFILQCYLFELRPHQMNESEQTKLIRQRRSDDKDDGDDGGDEGGDEGGEEPNENNNDNKDDGDDGGDEGGDEGGEEPNENNNDIHTFEVKSVLSTNNESSPQYWSPELTNTTTPAYIKLATSFCDTLMNSLKVENPSLSTDAKCTNVTFTSVELSKRQKRQANTIVDQNTQQGIQGTANIEIPSPQAKDLTAETFTTIINSGIKKSDKQTGLKLSNIETKKTTILKTTTVKQSKTTETTILKTTTVKQSKTTVNYLWIIIPIVVGVTLLTIILVGIIYMCHRKQSTLIIDRARINP